MTFASAFYTGTVVHRRIHPKRHFLKYRVFSMLIDLDELETLDAKTPGFGYNRWNLLSFWDKDHGPRDGARLRPWIEAALAKANIDLGGGAIRLLCYPRMFGYVFNPISVFYCYDTNQTLVALVYEVGNTFGEKHSYVIAVDASEAEGGLIRQECAKNFYVSPFVAMKARYEFRMRAPESSVSLGISEHDENGLFLFAGFDGERKHIDRSSVFKMLVQFPLMTFKVTAGIHWEALRLWLKGVPVHQHVPEPQNPITIVPKTLKKDKLSPNHAA